MPETVNDMARAFAEWRLANPGRVGWPLDAFKAGWEARASLDPEAAAPQRAHNLASDIDAVFGPG